MKTSGSFNENLNLKMKFSHFRSLLLAIILLAYSCKDESVAPALKLFSISLNGANLVDGMDNVPTVSSLGIVFSAAIDPAQFEKEFSISPSPASMMFNYANQSSKVTVGLVLELNTTYQVFLGQGAIGQNGGELDSPLSRSFTSLENEIIYSLPPCTSASNDCLQTISIGADGTGDLDFYSSFPIYEELAEWQELEAALLVVHGANRDADNYFNFLMATLQAANLEDKVVLIAPFFKNNQEASGNDAYWTNTGWREGNNSLDPASASSFEVMDRVLEQLADKAHFPVLKKILITGHSSGGLFTHLYAAANKQDGHYPHLAFEYIPANSQYYYYPDGQRIDENTNQLYTPSGCTGYAIYPIGFNILPPYLSETSEGAFNGQFTSRSITYLLGNGTGPDPTLNTSDCYATLLGSTRYRRGENMFRYMELAFPGGHNHQKTIVAGIGHDGQSMYQSTEFRSLLLQLLN